MAQSNPQSLQFLMEQMKQNASGLTKMQFEIENKHKFTLDERDMALNSRDEQLKGSNTEPPPATTDRHFVYNFFSNIKNLNLKHH